MLKTDTMGDGGNVSATRTGGIVGLLLALVAAQAWALPPEPRGDPRFWDAYHVGLVGLREARFDEATRSLTSALQFTPGDGRALLARGVAHAVTGRLAEAHADLSQARLDVVVDGRPKPSREPRLWLAALSALGYQPPGSRELFFGVPGHLVQGGDDYPTDYASCVIYEFARPTGGPAIAGADRKAARWFANRALAAEELCTRNFRWARSLVGQNQLAAAREVIDLARTRYAFEPDMAALSGDIWLKTGRPLSARRDYTLALTYDTTHRAAAAGRDHAIAMIGSDAGDPAALLASLDQQARGGASIEQLIPGALQLHRTMAARRVRYDELYQRRIAQCEDAWRADDAQVEARVDLAEYLLQESDNRGGTVEPRRGRVPFRYQHSKALELSRALHAADQALKRDPRHARAMVVKALILRELGRDRQADELVSAAVAAVGPSNARAVQLLAEYRVAQAQSMLMQAAMLRTPTFSTSTRTEHRHDGVWEVTTTTRYDPSSADLANAAALEQRAAQLMAEARATMEAAIRLTRGTHDGLLLESAYENFIGSRDKALALLRQAVAEHPDSLRAHDRLIEYLRLLGRRDEMIDQQAVSWQRFETTAAPLLGRVWDKVHQSGWHALMSDLNRARQLDPADARATAYLAMALANTGQRDQARAMATLTIALELARLALDEQGEAKRWTRQAGDFALAMKMHGLLADGSARRGDTADALAHHVAAATLAQRFPPQGAATMMWGAMMPDASAPPIPVPVPPNGATLASEALFGAGQALKAAGRDDEAQRYFLAATAWTGHPNLDTPNIGSGRPGDSNFVGRSGTASAEALVELAKADLAAGRFQQGMDRLQQATQLNPTRETRQQINALMLRYKDHMGR